MTAAETYTAAGHPRRHDLPAGTNPALPMRKQEYPMRKLATSVLALGLAFGTAGHAEEPNKLVTILTAPEAQTQLMAMVLTMNAMAAGA
jgi:hypothetical protein